MDKPQLLCPNCKILLKQMGKDIKRTSTLEEKVKGLKEEIRVHKRTIYGTDSKEIVSLRISPEHLDELEIDWKLYEVLEE